MDNEERALSKRSPSRVVRRRPESPSSGRRGDISLVPAHGHAKIDPNEGAPTNTTRSSANGDSARVTCALARWGELQLGVGERATASQLRHKNAPRLLSPPLQTLTVVKAEEAHRLHAPHKTERGFMLQTVPPDAGRPLERAPAGEPEHRRRSPLFEGFVLGGFECSDHRLADGRRLDLLASTCHDRFVEQDYARLRRMGMTACREGVSWVRSEPRQHQYEFGSVLQRVRAAERLGVQVIWDLLHFGWPDDVDVFDPAFPARFGRFAGAFARFYQGVSEAALFVSPINEMSFLAWAGGDVRYMYPFEAARGVELKVQLVLATIEAIEAIRSVVKGARFLSPEPVIHIERAPEQPKTWARVESDNLLQYQAWDMLEGRVWPRLGGKPSYLDIVGVNYYPDNQFMLDGTTVSRGDPRHRAFSALLQDVWERYRRPLLISETGCEGDARAEWMRYMGEECVKALHAGCELHGLTLYPVLDHAGWVDDRHCHNGLWGYADETGERPAHEPLVHEIRALSSRLHSERDTMLARATHASVAIAHGVEP
jgi:hypothetical protein